MAGTKVLIFGWASSIHVERWARGLTERGYDVKVVSPVGEPIDGIKTTILPGGSKLSYLRLASKAAAEAAGFEPDIVHVHYAGGLGLWGVRTGRRPLVVSAWGSDIADLPRRIFFRFLVRRVLRKATCVTATSRWLRQMTTALQPKVEGKIEVIPFGITLPDTAHEMPPPHPVKMCFIKAHRPVYGPDILLQALAVVKKRHPDIVLNMAGRGEMTGQLKGLVDQLGLRRNVNFVGYIDNSEISSFIGRHHFMVMPSLSESFGVAVLETAACARPAIASDVGGVPEVLQDGKTGLLVPAGAVDPLAEAINRLAEDVDLRFALGLAGRRFVKENFDWQKSLDMMTALYDRLLSA
ncbi:MAG: glycosyltransferase [Candidatus Zixiibacteriota bacterium]|nr:MAG: glycosyltransferase [candidate division Zixibacteria bacterium]